MRIAPCKIFSYKKIAKPPSVREVAWRFRAPRSHMVLGYHLVATAYGWWLPNDLRGSTSRTIRNDILRELGELHYGRKRVQPASRDIRAFYERAREVLKHELLEFSEADRLVVAEAFGDAINRNRYTCYACALMRDHVHLCIRKHKHQAEEMIANLHEASRLLLIARGLRPADHPVWGGPGWKVFLDSTDDLWRTVGYIEQNPSKSHQAPQHHPFVTTYDNWPHHLKSISPAIPHST
jgi:REP element-mobilizing transposase RayT